jgi:Domain of unknown function (DUF4404)
VIRWAGTAGMGWSGRGVRKLRPRWSLPQDFLGRFEFVHVAWRAMEQHTRRLLNEISEAMERAKDEDREELVRLHRAVERHVEGSGGDQAGLVNSLEMAEVRFEVDHPTLAQSIRQVLESLSSSGI